MRWGKANNGHTSTLVTPTIFLELLGVLYASNRYHDNRALYQDFLVEYAGEPALAASPVHTLTARFLARERPAGKALGRSGAVASTTALADSAGLAFVAGTAMAAMAAAQGISYQRIADMLYRVMSEDREVYTRMVVQRLTVDAKILTASEHFKDDAALPLPAQMFRFGAEEVMDNTEDFSYALFSLQPINKQNGPGTDPEKKGLEYVAENPGENFYGEEELGGERYFAAVHPDYAVVEACVKCHNTHKDSPHTGLEAGDMMGRVVIRIPME